MQMRINAKTWETLRTIYDIMVLRTVKLSTVPERLTAMLI